MVWRSYACTTTCTHAVMFISVDIQFYVFMHTVTDLGKEQIYCVFDMLDVDHSGMLDFDEFYLLVCVLIAVRVGAPLHKLQPIHSW